MSPRAIVGCLYVVAVVGLAIGAFAFGSFLLAEHRRLTVTESIFVWFGDGIAFVWFTVYFVRHFIFGTPIGDREPSPAQTGVLWWTALASIIGGMAVDIGYSLLLHADEHNAFASAKQSKGSLEVLRSANAGINKWMYQVRISFVDDNQKFHSFKQTLGDSRDLRHLPKQLAMAIRAGQRVDGVTVAYQADRPARAWIVDLGWERTHSLHEFSLLVMIFQVAISALFLLIMTQVRKRDGRFPWWYDLHAVLLIGVEAVFSLLFGSIFLAVDEPDFWG